MTLAREARVAELHQETRGVGPVVQLLIAAAAVALLPLVPGVERALGLDLADTVPAMVVFALAMLGATVAFHATGLSRWYWFADTVETWCSVGAVLYLVYASGSAISVFWLFFMIHGFFCAASDPWPRNHEAIPYALGPLAVALGFWLVDDNLADATISVVLGGCQMWVVTVLSRSTRNVEHLMDENTRLAADLAALRVSEERTRIARDLHDGLGAAMTSVLWQARAIEAASEGDAGARATELCDRVAGSLDELRGIVNTIRARARSWPMFVDELSRRCQAVARVPIVIETRTGDRDDLMLAGPLASECILAGLEMVRNADRHADASRIELRMEAGDAVRIVVADDGKGLGSTALAASDGGLANLQARAHALGGDLGVTSLDPGTRLEFVVPLPRSESAAASQI